MAGVSKHAHIRIPPTKLKNTTHFATIKGGQENHNRCGRCSLQPLKPRTPPHQEFRGRGTQSHRPKQEGGRNPQTLHSFDGIDFDAPISNTHHWARGYGRSGVTQGLRKINSGFADTKPKLAIAFAEDLQSCSQKGLHPWFAAHRFILRSVRYRCHKHASATRRGGN